MSAILKEVDKKIRALLGVVEFVTDIVVGSDGKFTALGAKTDDDDGNQLQGDIGWHLGFYSRPLDGSTGAVVKPGGKGGAAFLFCWRNRQYEVSLEKGDVAVANEAGAVSKWDKNGKITHTAASGQLVTINGEDYSEFNTEDFDTDLDTFLGTLSGLTPPVTLPNCAAAISSIITAAGNFATSKATNSDYKSTKAKHG